MTEDYKQPEALPHVKTKTSGTSSESDFERIVITHQDNKAIERAVMSDINRPCLFGVAGPCSHPKCLNAHFETLRNTEL